MKKIIFILISSLLFTGNFSFSQSEELPNTFSQTINNPIIEEIKCPEYDVPISKELQEYIWDICNEYNISYELVLAVISIESEFNSDAISHNKTSLGMMQLNKNTYPDLAKKLGIKNFNPFNPRHNIKAGIYYLAEIKDYWYSQGYSDEEVFALMLMNYNMGRKGTKRYVKKYGLECSYVDKVYEQKVRYEMIS